MIHEGLLWPQPSPAEGESPRFSRDCRNSASSAVVVGKVISLLHAFTWEYRVRLGESSTVASDLGRPPSEAPLRSTAPESSSTNAIRVILMHQDATSHQSSRSTRAASAWAALNQHVTQDHDRGRRTRRASLLFGKKKKTLSIVKFNSTQHANTGPCIRRATLWVRVENRNTHSTCRIRTFSLNKDIPGPHNLKGLFEGSDLVLRLGWNLSGFHLG